MRTLLLSIATLLIVFSMLALLSDDVMRAIYFVLAAMFFRPPPLTDAKRAEIERKTTLAE